MSIVGIEAGNFPSDAVTDAEAMRLRKEWRMKYGIAVPVLILVMFAVGCAEEADNVVTKSIGMKLVYIPPGVFMMGSGDSAAQLAKEYDVDERGFTAHLRPDNSHNR